MISKGNVRGKTAFRLTPSGQYTTIAQFVPTSAVRDLPANQLALGPDSFFYGVTEKSTIYRMTTSGKISLVADLTKAFASQPNCQTFQQKGLLAPARRSSGDRWRRHTLWRLGAMYL